jgi:hypothetical protein
MFGYRDARKQPPLDTLNALYLKLSTSRSGSNLRDLREVRTGRSRTFPRTFQRNVIEMEFSADFWNLRTVNLSMSVIDSLSERERERRPVHLSS